MCKRRKVSSGSYVRRFTLLLAIGILVSLGLPGAAAKSPNVRAAATAARADKGKDVSSKELALVLQEVNGDE